MCFIYKKKKKKLNLKWCKFCSFDTFRKFVCAQTSGVVRRLTLHWLGNFMSMPQFIACRWHKWKECGLLRVKDRNYICDHVDFPSPVYS